MRASGACARVTLMLHPLRQHAFRATWQDKSQREQGVRLPSISPDICLVNYYEKTGRLGLHQAVFKCGLLWLPWAFYSTIVSEQPVAESMPNQPRREPYFSPPKLHI
eukprot:1151976-Pelagomonas_calceolata.AAC.1